MNELITELRRKSYALSLLLEHLTNPTLAECGNGSRTVNDVLLNYHTLTRDIDRIMQEMKAEHGQDNLIKTSIYYNNNINNHEERK